MRRHCNHYYIIAAMARFDRGIYTYTKREPPPMPAGSKVRAVGNDEFGTIGRRTKKIHKYILYTCEMKGVPLLLWTGTRYG